MTDKELYTLTITPELAGQRLDKALAVLAAALDASLSRARLQALLAGGQVLRDGKPVTDASLRVKEGAVFHVHVPPPEAAQPAAQAIELEIVYEDKNLLVINKPAGMVVHPAPGNRDKTLVNALIAHCGDSLSGIGGVARPGIVHRLDKDTSGLMVVAKTDRAHQGLSEQFADRSLSRTYQALVWGHMAPPVGHIDAPIGRHARDRKKMAVTAKGKHAVTHYKALRHLTWNGKPVTLVQCKLETGRTHQIRVHLTHIKHPLLGDPVYGRRMAAGHRLDFPRQALHAAALQFIHPVSGKTMKFEAVLPADMAALLAGLKS
ncbi:MAG: RluA family pseudouridine synthase [Alphaproteobacteria bacterium]|nr:RluA family pseudouridine synthase [Alphaproteobacteria bacterium]MBV8548239.1 RluA family pseudouridine synthase [Alphaproteobacteria bacterium]